MRKREGSNSKPRLSGEVFGILHLFDRIICLNLFLGTSCDYHYNVINLKAGLGHSTVLFETPNFGGVGKYLPDLECIWNITGPPHQRIQLRYPSHKIIPIPWMNMRDPRIVTFPWHIIVTFPRHFIITFPLSVPYHC